MREVMVVKKKRKPLSVIIEASEGYHVHASPSKVRISTCLLSQCSTVC